MRSEVRQACWASTVRRRLASGENLAGALKEHRAYCDTFCDGAQGNRERPEKEPAATTCPKRGSGFCRSLAVTYPLPNPQSVSSAGRRIPGHRRRFIVNLHPMAVPGAHDDGEGRSSGDEPLWITRETAAKAAAYQRARGSATLCVGAPVARRGCGKCAGGRVACIARSATRSGGWLQQPEVCGLGLQEMVGVRGRGAGGGRPDHGGLPRGFGHEAVDDGEGRADAARTAEKR